MGKYLVLWELDHEKIPVDPKERGTGWTILIDIVKQDIKEGLTTDWGAFVGEASGYFVAEGTEVEIMTYLQRFVPFVMFRTHPIASVSQIEEMIATLGK